MFKKINKIFFEDPLKEFNVREIARMINISPATASKELKALAKKGILKQRKERNLILYKANMESDLYCDMKIFYNIRKIKDSGFLDALNRFYLKPSIVLFGSACTGLDVRSSDIDLLIISEKEKEFPEIEKYEKKLNRSIQLIVQSDIKNIKNKHLVNNILNGITLQGEITWT